ncbi:MAG: hypothetical protein MJ003_07270 [Paludibacteraceae bacterium]|nr:hypothetical protein [Paludibacteraceae bacterium]
MKVRNFLILCLAVVLASCNGGKQEGSGAEKLYAKADSACKAGNYNLSKVLIDSIHKIYRMDVEIRKKAKSLMSEVDSIEYARTQAYFDSIRPFRQATADSLLKNFTVSSDTAYYNYKKYVHKNQNAAAPRKSLIAEVKEDGELQLISVYMGSKLNHKKVKVSNKENFYVETETIGLDSPYNNRFDDFGTRWEYLTFTGDNMGDVPVFIYSNFDKPLKITLIADSIETKKGKKASTYIYMLDPQDRTAIKQAVELSNVLNELNKMRL